MSEGEWWVVIAAALTVYAAIAAFGVWAVGRVFRRGRLGVRSREDRSSGLDASFDRLEERIESVHAKVRLLLEWQERRDQR